MIDIIGASFKENGKIYYFAIASEYNGVIGPLSEEFFARPLLKYY